MRKHGDTVVAERRNNLFEDEAPDGAFTAFVGMGRFHCICPCGCGSHLNLSVYLEGQEKPTLVAWTWNGGVEHPTLAPSIRDLSGCKFHGHLTKGVWTFEVDSGA